MKPAPFDYRAPRSLDAALELIAGEDARPLAGGQSLIPMLNFRLARPSRLVDLHLVAGLDAMRVSRGDGCLSIGAMTTQAMVERSPEVAQRWPLLAEAVAHVGHAAIRARGTVGGSVAHADPAAELPTALTALDARFRLCSVRGERTLTASELFCGALTTAIASDELLVEVEVPVAPPGARMAFVEHARTHGDFAQGGVAVVVAADRHASVALLGAGPTPVRAPDAERALIEGADARQAAELAVTRLPDGHRRALLRALVVRALERVGR
ncbi:MAG TPA: FAD binding domain-containing protein [Solirubrobacteraceae bacterium]|nr:FAD binding domain-containing protein [Solirubrobacteraceae bacterium]